jgi:hypothetical protein
MKTRITLYMVTLTLLILNISCSLKNCQLIDQVIIDNVSLYENANKVIKDNVTALSNYKDTNMIILGKEEVSEILSQKNNEDLRSLIKLWDDNLLIDKNSIQMNIKNEELVIFQVKRCKNYIHEIIYDPSHIYGIGITDDVAGIKEKWINKDWKYYIIRVVAR